MRLITHTVANQQLMAKQNSFFPFVLHRHNNRKIKSYLIIKKLNNKFNLNNKIYTQAILALFLKKESLVSLKIMNKFEIIIKKIYKIDAFISNHQQVDLPNYQKKK